MNKIGIALIVLGILNVLGNIMLIVEEHEPFNYIGFGFSIVCILGGIYLIKRAEAKKIEEE